MRFLLFVVLQTFLGGLALINAMTSPVVLLATAAATTSTTSTGGTGTIPPDAYLWYYDCPGLQPAATVFGPPLHVMNNTSSSEGGQPLPPFTLTINRASAAAFITTTAPTASTANSPSSAPSSASPFVEVGVTAAANTTTTPPSSSSSNLKVAYAQLNMDFRTSNNSSDSGEAIDESEGDLTKKQDNHSSSRAYFHRYAAARWSSACLFYGHLQVVVDGTDLAKLLPTAQPSTTTATGTTTSSTAGVAVAVARHASDQSHHHREPLVRARTHDDRQPIGAARVVNGTCYYFHVRVVAWQCYTSFMPVCPLLLSNASQLVVAASRSTATAVNGSSSEFLSLYLVVNIYNVVSRLYDASQFRLEHSTVTALDCRAKALQLCLLSTYSTSVSNGLLVQNSSQLVVHNAAVSAVNCTATDTSTGTSLTLFLLQLLNAVTAHENGSQLLSKIAP